MIIFEGQVAYRDAAHRDTIMENGVYTNMTPTGNTNSSRVKLEVSSLTLEIPIANQA
jgi:hypothetical protein